MSKRKPKPETLTKRQLDRALLSLFNVEESVIPRCAMRIKLYFYAQALWEKSKGKATRATRIRLR